MELLHKNSQQAQFADHFSRKATTRGHKLVYEEVVEALYKRFNV